ncbi:hypothetical protein EIP91_000348 [Steccherinum ochraceum]|uniref:Autophagy-related protein 11 n=1 Tax=Steccherinum ochraceum TaxID=92696 RepID=A0A4R0RPG1_9APHY|nr:hypothetical protein EIP91_000348 [Steccherinum ochraceum]
MKLVEVGDSVDTALHQGRRVVEEVGLSCSSDLVDIQEALSDLRQKHAGYASDAKRAVDDLQGQVTSLSLREKVSRRHALDELTRWKERTFRDRIEEHARAQGPQLQLLALLLRDLADHIQSDLAEDNDKAKARIMELNASYDTVDAKLNELPLTIFYSQIETAPKCVSKPTVSQLSVERWALTVSRGPGQGSSAVFASMLGLTQDKRHLRTMYTSDKVKLLEKRRRELDVELQDISELRDTLTQKGAAISSVLCAASNLRNAADLMMTLASESTVVNDAYMQLSSAHQQLESLLRSGCKRRHPRYFAVTHHLEKELVETSTILAVFE